MLVRILARRRLCMSLVVFCLSGCFHPPFNNFRPEPRTLKEGIATTAIGAGAGAAIGSLGGVAPAGALIGGVAGAGVAFYHNNQQALIKQLRSQHIEYYVYGDTMTLLVPTDEYFNFNSPKLNDICFPGLNNIVRLLSYYPNSPIYVAAFTDEIGSRYHKKMLSQGRAETMLSFLWANGISAQRLNAEGYRDKHDIADNHWIHGSAFNRRVEIQWINTSAAAPGRVLPAPYLAATK